MITILAIIPWYVHTFVRRLHDQGENSKKRYQITKREILKLRN